MTESQLEYTTMSDTPFTEDKKILRIRNCEKKQYLEIEEQDVENLVYSLREVFPGKWWKEIGG
jgi:hypothetical protein